MNRRTIRRATPDDAPIVAAVHRRSSAAAAGDGSPLASVATGVADGQDGYWRTRLARPAAGAAAWVAEDGAGAVVGFCLAGPSPDDGGAAVGHVHALYVLPEAAGRGIGSALLTAALRHLRAAGFSEATLWVGAVNARARAFYETRGWQTDGARYEDATVGGFAVSVRYRRTLPGRRTS